MFNMKERFLDMFRMDLRLLGIFRILLGLLVILDLINRSTDLTTFYTDEGVIPRKILLDNNWADWSFSINMASGSYEGQLLFFSLAFLFAFMVLIGYRTKLFLVLLYISVISLQIRNPQINIGGDLVIKMLIFYSIFLPVNARFAVDRFQAKTLPVSGKILSVATIAYILQAIYIYVFSAMAKTGIDWHNGTAVYYALSLDMFETPLTGLLMAMPKVMELLTYYTYYLEKFGFILLFIPFAWRYFRLLGGLLFMGLHFGFFLFMAIGFFPWIAMLMWIPILPPMVGDFLESNAKNWGIYAKLAHLRNRLRGGFTMERLQLGLPEKGFKKLGVLPSVFLAVVAVCIFLWNMSNVKKLTCPEPVKYIVRATVTWQNWNMFAPYPLKADGWYVMDAQLQSGDHIDILNDREVVDFSKPDMVSSTFKNERWVKYLENRKGKKNTAYLLAWGGYYCKCWNRKHGNTSRELESFSIFFMEEMTPPPGKPIPEPKKIKLWSHWCKEKFKNRFD